MGRLRAKLKSQTGASLMVALLFFVMMAVIGSVILAAASAGAGRVKDEDEGDQERYALYSAANMVMNAFADHDAFSKFSHYNQKDHQLTIPETHTISYYVNVDTNANYTDHDLTKPYNLSSDLQWTVPEFATKTSTANNLRDIQEILAEQILNEYWKNITIPSNVDKWDFGSTEYWSDIVNKNKALSEKHESFTITPTEKWAEKSKENADKYQVRADMTMGPDFDITVSLHLVDENINYQKYTVEIPFEVNAKVQLGTTPSKGEPYPIYKIPNDSTSGIVAYGQNVSESGSVIFTNFRWKQKKDVKITTLDLDSTSTSATK